MARAMTTATSRGALADLPPGEFFTLYGEVLFLLFHAPLHRVYTVEEIEERIVRPMTLDQFRIYRREDGPVALVTWAFVSDELDARLQTEQTPLGPDDWRSGPNLWFVEFVAPFGHTGAVLGDLVDNVFPDHVGKSHKVTGRPDRPWILKRYYGKNRRGRRV